MDIYTFVSQLMDLGYSVIPGYSYRNPQPYSNGEIYPPGEKVVSKWGKVYCPWHDADKVGIRLDKCLLIDYDGNKEDKPELTVPQLAKLMGVEDMRPALCQWGLTPDGKYNGSFHFLFRFPAILNNDNYYHSQDGKIHGIDVKTGNQLMWIKRGKIQNMKPVKDVPQATRQMLEFLKKPPEEQTQNNSQARIKSHNESKERGLMWLQTAADNLASTGQGGRNHKMNSTALSAVRHALANEFSMQLAESMIKSAAAECGLSKEEIRDTWKSAHRKGLRAGPKNLLERPR